MDRFRVTYRLRCAAGEDPAAKAADLAREQTVELPGACLSPAIIRDVVGSIQEMERVGDEVWRVVIAYANTTAGDDLLQYVSLLFGNISLQRGILITDVEVPPVIRERCGGPRFGIEGLRRLVADGAGRPLLCAAAKPLGLSARELAAVCHALAAGGIDIVKDDHGLANQPAAPFRERVVRCQDAVERANVTSGGKTLYFPNLSVAEWDLAERLAFARSVGCRGALVSPLLLGLDVVRHIAAQEGMVLLAHPALAGAYFRADHGIVPDVLLGLLFRLIGSDGVIYPNVGGRFALSRPECEAINARLRGPIEGLRTAFPVPAGGIDVDRIPYWIGEYGVDTMFLIGGSLYVQADLQGASERLVEAVRLQCSTR